MGDIKVSLTSGYVVQFDGMLRHQLSDVTSPPSDGAPSHDEETTCGLKRNPTERSWSTDSDDKEDDDDAKNKTNVDHLSNFIKDLSIGDYSSEADLLPHGPKGGVPTSWNSAPPPCYPNTVVLNGGASVSSASRSQFQTAYQWPEQMKAVAFAASVSALQGQGSVETVLFAQQKRKTATDENETNIPHQFVQQYQYRPSTTVSDLFDQPVKFTRCDGSPAGDPQENDETQATSGYLSGGSSSQVRSVNSAPNAAGVRPGVRGTRPNGVILFTPVSNSGGRNDNPMSKITASGIQVIGQSQPMYPDINRQVAIKKDENVEDILDNIDTASLNNYATMLGMDEYVIPGSTTADNSTNDRDSNPFQLRPYAPFDDEDNVNLTSPGPSQSPTDSGIIDMYCQMSPTSSTRHGSSSPPFQKPPSTERITSASTETGIGWSLPTSCSILTEVTPPEMWSSSVYNNEPSSTTDQPLRGVSSATSGPLDRQRNDTQQTVMMMIERHEQAKAGIYQTRYTRDDLMAIDNEGNTVLHRALQKRQLYVAEALIYRLDRESLTASIVNQRNLRTFETPLWLAASLGSPKIVELLVSRMANVNAQVYERQSPFRRAMKTDGTEPLAFCSVLHHLSSSGAGDASLSTLKEILKSPNVEITAFDSAGRTALHRAVEAHGQRMIDSCDNIYIIDSTEIIRELVQRGADVCQQDMVRQQTVLHWAVDRAMVLNNLHLVHHLLDLQANVISSEAHATTTTPLSVIGRGLTNHGSTVNPTAKSEFSPGLCAPATTRAVNECSGSGRKTLLHIIAAADGNDDVDDGDSVSAKTGCDVIDRRSLRMELIRLLVNHDANTCAINEVGKTPAQLARSPEIISLLLQGRFNAS